MPAEKKMSEEDSLLLQLDRRSVLKEQIKKAEKEIDDININTKVFLATRGLEESKIGRWISKVVTFNKETIKKEKLLMAGVSIDTITKATEVTIVEQLRIDLDRNS